MTPYRRSGRGSATIAAVRPKTVWLFLYINLLVLNPEGRDAVAMGGMGVVHSGAWAVATRHAGTGRLPIVDGDPTKFAKSGARRPASLAAVAFARKRHRSVIFQPDDSAKRHRESSAVTAPLALLHPAIANAKKNKEGHRVLPLKIFNNEPDIRSFEAGQIIFEEDSPGDFLYALLEGEVEIVRHGKVLETVHTGGVFGEMALIDQQTRTASAIATTPIRVAAITEKRFNLLVSQNPPFALAMMRLLAERVRHNLAS